MARWTGWRLSAAAILLAAVLLAPGRARSAGPCSVILMIADGFGPQQLGAALLVSERLLDRRLCMAEGMRRGTTGLLLNDTADAVVTESAAAATQIATGQLARARVLSMSPEPPPAGTPWQTVLEIAQEREMSTGLVTTSGITDATPGAFAAHLLLRDQEDRVAEQELAHGVDVLMGGRREYFLPSSVPGSRRGDGRDLMAEARDAGYAVVQDERSLLQVTRGRVLGLFDVGNMAYEAQREGTGQPSLATMTARTLALLAQGRRGFFAMIEGGRIDHAAHANDAGNAIQEALAFDEAVCIALEYQARSPDTLLVVTSDHDTGGMALVGRAGGDARDGDRAGLDLEALAPGGITLQRLVEQLGEPGSPAAVQEKVRRKLGVELTQAEARRVYEEAVRNRGAAAGGARKTARTLAFALLPHLRVGFATGGHTASPLLVWGVGPGSERLAGLHHNTELFAIMARALRAE